MPLYDTSLANNTGGSSVSTDQTFSFTVGTNSNRWLGLWLNVIANSFPISGVTFNAAALTNRREKIHGSESFLRMQLWDIIAPDEGAHNVVIGVTGACRLAWGVVSLYDVHQTTPRGTIADSEGSSTTPSLTVSSASGELVLDGVSPSGTRTLTQDGSQSLNAKIETFDCIGSSREAGAASVAMDWTLDSSDLWIMIGLPLKPAPAGGTPVESWHPPIERQHLQKSEIIAY